MELFGQIVRPVVNTAIGSSEAPPEPEADRESPDCRAAVRQALLDVRQAISMELPHFIVSPHRNTRHEPIECVEYWPLKDLIDAKLAGLEREP